MTSLARIRPSLRRAAFVAALGALMVPATAGAAVHADASAKKKKAKAPVVRRVAPMAVEIGQKLEIRGRYFRRGRNKNTVVFKRKRGKAVFVKAEIGTTKLLRLTLPSKLQKALRKRGTTPLPTRFRVRVLTKKFGKKFTKASRSPVISPASPAVSGESAESLPDGDCDGDGARNRTETDDDNDLLSDDLETQIGTDKCILDSDDDGVEDGYEYQSAHDLNDDGHQHPQEYLPQLGRTRYPNPLFKDADVDYDGDTLTLGEEQSLWQLVGQRTLSPLSYSDGKQYTVSLLITSGPETGRREPTLGARTYVKRQAFIDWATMAGYRQVSLVNGPPWYRSDTETETQRTTYGLFDVDRSGGESDAELFYNDMDGDHFLSDDERDEDADGLTNYDESHGRMNENYWTGCYTSEKVFQVGYTGTDMVNADTDRDGVRDGADDTDYDDIPNLDELSRIHASHHDDREPPRMTCTPRTTGVALDPKDNHSADYGRVNPFNPCLPARFSRSCPNAVSSTTGAPFDGSPDWYALQ